MIFLKIWCFCFIVFYLLPFILFILQRLLSFNEIRRFCSQECKDLKNLAEIEVAPTLAIFFKITQVRIFSSIMKLGN